MSGLTVIHSRSGGGELRKGAMKTFAGAPLGPAANAIQRPSGEKRAPNTLPLRGERTGCRLPVEIFIRSIFFVSPGWNVSKLEPSGDQSQMLKQPFNSVSRPGGPR